MRAMTEPEPPPEAVPSFRWPVRVYYEDTDAGGIVYYANYLRFFERARTEWLRACGLDQRRLAAETGAMFVVRDTAVDYRAPARLDDPLTIVSRIERFGRASLIFVQEAWLGDLLLVSGRTGIGWVDRETLRPTGIPPSVRVALERGPVPGVSTAEA
ncbi:tol-pal system-associated acyl-CoA thioesterase [Burkholderia gladioli]|uniref:tol-pal system-associated acyl-CoA thioesterase n=1 Tax=Burkholderia gladioli TaxID=28095 RepID=UPI00163FB6EA|nr:tol-pal system-associated acyl-CoA thioesterase [Burkholderia gladioli]